MSESRTNISAAPAIPSPTIRNRLSLFLQLAPPGISKSKATSPRRSLTPGKRSPRKEAESGLSCAVSRSSDRPAPDAAASTASFADSLASAPHGSLLFKTRSTDVLLPTGPFRGWSAPIPATTNELDAEDKMRLMKSVRKLSRVLGEYALPVGLHDQAPTPGGQITAGETYPGSVPASPLSGARGSQRKSFRHSWSIGCSAGVSAPSSADPLSLSLSSSSPPPTPTSPLEFAALPDTSSRSPSFEAASAECTDAMSPEEMQRVRARAARLTRHLGDDVPPELLFRAASPPPPGASAPPLPPPATVLKSPRRSASLRRKKAPARTTRRLSLDSQALDAAKPSPMSAARPSTSSGSKQGAAKLEKPVKRSRSVWARKFSVEGPRFDSDPPRDDPSPTRDSFDTPATEPVSEKERIMNVKRAKKMTQYFGDQPPTALFQITNFTQGVSDDELHRLRRDSLATILSISSSVSVAHLDGRAVRDSYISMSSIMSSSSSGGAPADAVTAVTTTAEVIIDRDDGSTALLDPEQGEDTLSRAQYEFPLPPSTPPSASARFGSLSPPHSPPAGSTTISVYHTPYQHGPPSPRASPPFSDVISVAPRSTFESNTSVTSLVNEVPSDSGRTSLEFHMRQKRAAKLSKFFGVEMNTLAGVLPANPRLSSVDGRHNHRGPARFVDQRLVVSSDEVVPSVMVLESTAAAGASTGARVEVSSEPGKGPLRFLHGQNAREMDMNDAIEKLRRMKSV